MVAAAFLAGGERYTGEACHEAGRESLPGHLVNLCLVLTAPRVGFATRENRKSTMAIVAAHRAAAARHAEGSFRSVCSSCAMTDKPNGAHHRR